MKKRIIQISIIVFLMSLVISLLPKTGKQAQAQFIPLLNRYGFNIPYYTPYYTPLLSPMIRTTGLINRYPGIYSPFIPAPPIMSRPQPITRQLHALTTITNIKVIFPPSTTTLVLNPYISPLITPVSSVTIPVTSAAAQPILVAAGLVSPVDPSTSYIYNILSASLDVPSLTSILPPSVASILSIVP